jgi:hypothetical protein
MHRISFIALLLTLTLSTQLGAQLGLSVSRLHPSATDWNNSFPTGNNPEIQAWWQQTGYHVGLDYWFRLKEVRIEFYPELGYSRYATERPAYQGGMALLQWHTNIYPMDFWDDCDCPTFSKQDPWFQRGFFFQVSPGIGALHHQFNEGNQPESIQWNLIYSLAAGAGLDIGISDRLTLSPYARWNYFFSANYQDWAATPPFEIVPPSQRPTSGESKLSQWEFGLRIGFRWK